MSVKSMPNMRSSAWIATALSVTVMVISHVAAFADDSDQDITARLAKDEKLALGHSNSSLPLKKRLELFEKAIFGQTQGGDDNLRVARIEKGIGLTNTGPDPDPVSSSNQPGDNAPAATSIQSSNNDHSEKSQVVQIGVSHTHTLNEHPQEQTPAVPPQDTTAVTTTNTTAPPPAPPPAPPAPQPMPSLRDLMKQASDAMNNHDLATAGKLYASVAERDPYNDKAFFQLGQIAASKGDPIDALMYFRIAFNMQPDDNEYKGAVNYWETQVRDRVNRSYHIANYYRWPNDLSGLLNQGVRFWSINAIDQAKLLFERVVSLDPNNIDGWFNLGVTEERQGNLQQALDDYHRAMSILQTPGAEQLLGPPPPTKVSMFQLFANGFRPRGRMLSSTVDSGEDRQFSLNSQLYSAIAEVSEKLQNPQAVVQKVGWPVVGVQDPQSYYRYQGSQLDTCDRCRIVRSQKMNPS